jgi:hypothetical protein
MGARTPTSQTPDAPDLPTGPGADPGPRDQSTPQGGKILALGTIFFKTIGHFWPGVNAWGDQLPDTRWQFLVTYEARFLLWWGLLLFCFKLGSRRDLDYKLRDVELLALLGNINQLTQTQHDTLPVHKTLDHFLGHVGSAALADLRTEFVRRLMRNKVLDRFRFDGEFVFATDGTGYLVFKERHCPHCLEHSNGKSVYYLHPVLEAKIVHTSGLAISIGTEFIENPLPEKPAPAAAKLTDYESVKQDCELKAFLRLAPQLKATYPQTRFCLATDSLMACGPVLSVCERYGWSYVLTFKPGRTPALWADFEGLLKLNPDHRLKVWLSDQKTHQSFRWVNNLHYVDSDKHAHTVSALLCEETVDGQVTTYSWLTNKRLCAANVASVASEAGRVRFKIENQGFNIQKNSGLNLEHAYSLGPDTLKCYYYLLQIAHLFLQMLEMGSLLQQLARQYGATPLALFGSLKNIAEFLLDCFRYFRLQPEAFAPSKAFQIRLLDSS